MCKSKMHRTILIQLHLKKIWFVLTTPDESIKNQETMATFVVNEFRKWVNSTKAHWKYQYLYAHFTAVSR